MLSKFKHVHLVGIGGAGMSAIAQVLLYRGLKVSGSDPADNDIIHRLKDMGAIIYPSHEARNIEGADLVATSTAISADNPERNAAEKADIPVWHRARVLAEIMRCGQSVAVSGTHGKTTTTAMLGHMLVAAELDPTVLIGGWLNVFNGNARTGSGEWVVAEADESDASFLMMTPDRIIMTNVEADHLDFYADLEAVYQSFRNFMGNLRSGGKIIACLDDPGVRHLLAENHGCDVIGYGIDSAEAELRAENILPFEGGAGSIFDVTWRGQKMGRVHLRVPGRHNVLNALAALATGLDIGAPFGPMAEALAQYGGARRRFQFKGQCNGITVVDDYAHHPTELRATLAAARSQVESGLYKRLVASFQPHRYSRTKALMDDFAHALLDSDLLVLTEVYSAGEKPIEGVSGRQIADLAQQAGHTQVSFAPTLAALQHALFDLVQPGDLVLTLGAGSIFHAGENLLEQLARTTATKAH